MPSGIGSTLRPVTWKLTTPDIVGHENDEAPNNCPSCSQKVVTELKKDTQWLHEMVELRNVMLCYVMLRYLMAIKTAN